MTFCSVFRRRQFLIRLLRIIYAVIIKWRVESSFSRFLDNLCWRATSFVDDGKKSVFAPFRYYLLRVSNIVGIKNERSRGLVENSRSIPISEFIDRAITIPERVKTKWMTTICGAFVVVGYRMTNASNVNRLFNIFDDHNKRKASGPTKSTAHRQDGISIDE